MSELIDESHVIRATVVGCAIKIARRIHGDAGDRLSPIRSAVEKVQNGQSLRWCRWDHGENYHENGQSNEVAFLARKLMSKIEAAIGCWAMLVSSHNARLA